MEPKKMGPKSLANTKAPLEPDHPMYSFRWMVSSHFREVEGVLDEMQRRAEDNRRASHAALAETKGLLVQANDRIKALEAELARMKATVPDAA